MYLTGGFIANREIWLLGAQILQDLRPCFESLVKLHQEGRERQYVFDHYDFKLTRNETTVNILSQVTNSMNKALSSAQRLPTFIIVFLEDLMFTSAEIYLPSEIEAQLRWIFANIDQSLKERKKIMPNKSLRPQEPKILLVKSLPRYDFGTMKLSYSEFTYRQDRYNILLQQIGRCFGFETIDTQSISPRDMLCFDESGSGRQFSNRGKYRFWRELCQTIAEIDKSKDRDNRRRILQEELQRHNRQPHSYKPDYY